MKPQTIGVSDHDGAWDATSRLAAILRKYKLTDRWLIEVRRTVAGFYVSVVSADASVEWGTW